MLPWLAGRLWRGQHGESFREGDNIRPEGNSKHGHREGTAGYTDVKVRGVFFAPAVTFAVRGAAYLAGAVTPGDMGWEGVW